MTRTFLAHAGLRRNFSLRAIARALGGQLIGRQALCPGPGHSPRDRSLAVSLSATGEVIVHSFSGDDWRACRDYVYERLGVDRNAWKSHTELRIEAPRRASPRDSSVANGERALEIWHEAKEPAGTPVETYLGARRLVLADDIGGRVVRYHERCPWRDDDGRLVRVPAMVVLMRSATTDQACAVQRTRLTGDGEKIGRKMLGLAKGAAIKLDSDAGVTSGLHIAEGLETALSARQLGLRPTWALGSAGGIERLPVLAGIESLTILRETDDANFKASQQCAERWSAAGREVIFGTPTFHGDMNDVLVRAP